MRSVTHVKGKQLPITLTARQIATIGAAGGQLSYSKSGVFAGRVIARLRATAGHGGQPTDAEVEDAIASAMIGLRHHAAK